MNNEEWWAAERAAAEFWRKVREHQLSVHGGSGLQYEQAATPTDGYGEFGPTMRRQLPDIQHLCASF